jgi:hypothetical protein
MERRGTQAVDEAGNAGERVAQVLLAIAEVAAERECDVRRGASS